MTRTNILILMPDQMRADCLSSAGHAHVHTPHLDRLSADGLRFSSAYTTNPLCMPARASFLTGLYSHNHGIWENYGGVAKRAETYLRHLARAGYHTCQIGKAHFYPHPGVPSLERRRHRRYLKALGFAEVREVTGPLATMETDSILTREWKRRGLLETFRRDYARREEVGHLDATWPSPLPEGETLDDFIAGQAIDFLENHKPGRPFATFVGFGGPHHPWDAPASWAAHYDPTRMDEARPSFAPGSHVPEAAAGWQRAAQDHIAPTGEQMGRVRAMYYAKISHLDALVGRIVETLERRGLLENTAILFWSDHGEMLGDRGLLGKRVLFEEAVRVPVILRLPGAAGAGAVVDTPVSILDAYPTLLALADFAGDTHRGFGRSLLPFARDPGAPHHDAVFAELQDARPDSGSDRPPPPRYEMVRDARFKLVRRTEGEVLLLHDLHEDPEETENLLGQVGTEAVAERLQRRLDRWRRETETLP